MFHPITFISAIITLILYILGFVFLGWEAMVCFIGAMFLAMLLAIDSAVEEEGEVH
ncbi:hypothetical protein [Peribacillus asahii]|uniref:hypothetical protein n=1 Tax=Peribacillus asahii TaxID=228899 RepID=UPI002079E9CC|nr:hypothetical protein [Peribacillus asahii]USK62356.1 hypothetical protein LIT37_22935 [Peribacillus asahii]